VIFRFGNLAFVADARAFAISAAAVNARANTVALFKKLFSANYPVFYSIHELVLHLFMKI
jgi:hypothetical protein